ncbi:cupredoxin domain-containing protein, partial [Streptomyces sp. NPDC007861]|uniref:cupredoxin domain-containing protein n=1 Tax=Streptomyces sp. NPDC007861 TaxID=3154893 RepID=UPI0033E4DFC3
MSAADIGVVGGAIVLIVFLVWYFFGTKKSSQAELKGGVQEIGIMVKGSYAPDLIRVRQGVPVRLVFDRQEGGDCTSRVLFPDFRLAASLPAFATTVVEFTPDRVGRFGFVCGMSMVHGTLLVEPGDGETPVPAAGATAAKPASPARPEAGAAEREDAEAAARREEIAD